MIEMTNQLQLLFPVLTEDQVNAILNPDEPSCPFHASKYIGNRGAVDEILDLAYDAFETRLRDENSDIVCPRACPKRIVLLGRPSVGKTTFAKIFAKEILDLPFCIALPEQVNSAVALFDLLKQAYSEYDLDIEVEEIRGDTEYFILPPAVLFIDEVHLLSPKVQDSLLAVTEANDGTLKIDGGVVDCRNLCVIIATTDKGKLRKAFKTRFKPINLQPYSLSEIAQIVKINQPAWSDEDCAKVARLKPIPREAKDFSESVVLCAKRKRMPVAEAIKTVADREGVGEFGLNINAIRTLKILRESEEGLSRASLCAALGIESDEFENDIMPCLVANELHPAYIAITNKHNITREGKKYLRG